MLNGLCSLEDYFHATAVERLREAIRGSGCGCVRLHEWQMGCGGLSEMARRRLRRCPWGQSSAEAPATSNPDWSHQWNRRHLLSVLNEP